MSKDKYPVTPAIRILKQHNADFIPYEYEYEEKGGTAQSARELGVEEHSVVKTLIFDSEKGALCALMHGDCEVSTKELARLLNVKTIVPCDEKKAHNTTGYQFGGTSPFGTKKSIPVYAEKTIFDLERIYINGGKRGFLIEIKPLLLKTILNAVEINVAIKK